MILLLASTTAWPPLAGLLLVTLCVFAARGTEADADGTNDAAAPNDAQPDRSVTYRTLNGANLELYVFEPAGHAPGSARPAIVFFHGGAWRKGAPAQFYWQSRYLAQRGLVCFNARYRLIPNAPTVDACVEDAQAAVAYVRTHAAELGVDPQRLAAGGGSAGGHLAAACAVRTGGPAACRPDLLVLFNPALFHKSAQQTIKLEQFTRETPPAIYFMGDQDDMLAYAVDCLAQAKRLGNEARLFTAAGEGHGFFNRPPWRESTLFEADRFLVRHGYLQGAPALKVPQGAALQERD